MIDASFDYSIPPHTDNSCCIMEVLHVLHSECNCIRHPAATANVVRVAQKFVIFSSERRRRQLELYETIPPAGTTYLRPRKKQKHRNNTLNNIRTVSLEVKRHATNVAFCNHFGNRRNLLADWRAGKLFGSALWWLMARKRRRRIRAGASPQCGTIWNTCWKQSNLKRRPAVYRAVWIYVTHIAASRFICSRTTDCVDFCEENMLSSDKPPAKPPPELSE